MKRKNIALSTLAIATLIMAGVYSINTIKADESGNYPPIVQKLAERFNLNEDDIEAVFDETREEHHQEMESRFEEWLNQAVSDSKITEEQKDQIMAKHEKMMENKEVWRELNPEERKAKAQALHEELQQWAEDNDIDMSLLKIGQGPEFKRGFKAGYHFGYGK